MQAPRVVRSSRTLSRVVIGGLVVGMLVDLISLIHNLSGKTLIEQAVAGTVGADELIAWDTTFATIGLGQTVTYVATAIVWLIWQYRLVSSVQPLTGDEPHKSPGRSLIWWFVPWLNLVVVYRIYGDLRDKLAPAAGSIVGQWWGLYLVSNMVTYVTGLLWRSANDAEALISGLNLWVLSDSLTIIAALFAVRLILRLQGGQDVLITRPPGAIAINTLEQVVAPVEAG